MNSILLVLYLVSCVFSLPTDQTVISRVPSEIEAASIARTLVKRESLTNINTIKKYELKDGSTKDVPVSYSEYYADCDNDGDPYWLVIDIGTTYQNIVKGSDYSFSIRVGDHHINDKVNPSYPGGITNSPAGSPRVNLRGELKNVSFPNIVDLLKLEKCFIDRHPDSKYWLPSNPITPHNSHWVKLHVDDIYIIGGFGDRAYIGSVDSSIYHSVSTIDK